MRWLLLVVAAALAVAACGGGPETTQTRQVGSFDRLSVSGDIEVEMGSGDSRDVVVTAGENVIDHVVTQASGGVLRVAIRDRGIVIGPDPYKNVRVQVPASVLEDIRVEGSSHLRLGRIDTDRLAIEVVGSGDVEASGRVGTLVATIDGSGDAHLYDLEAGTATVTVEGAGDAELNVRDRLDVTVQGAGDVRYRGRPSVRQTVEGAGDIRPAD
jgi:Putative auto-transporter adhesin, head GIN domain